MSENYAPRRIAFEIADTYRTEVGVTFENESVPFRRRVVVIELTDAQRELLRPRQVGVSRGTARYEEVLQAFIDHDAPPEPS